MTGTIDLSIEQLTTIAKQAELDADVRTVIRVIIHPANDGAVRVETRSLSFGDVLHGHFYVLRNGEKLTGREYDEYEGERVTAPFFVERTRAKHEVYEA